jgi:flagellar hook-associated protein 3 FlgL
MINSTGNRLTMEIRRQSQLAQQIARSQVEISTGRRIQSASDDPVAAARVATIRQAQSDDSIWRDNLSLGASLASQADGVLQTTSERLARAQELVVAGASQSLSSTDRVTIALELHGIADEIDSIAGTRSSLGTPLFATSSASEIRFGESTTFAPVASRSDIFETGGTAISELVRTAATAVESGKNAQVGTSLTAIKGGIDHISDANADIGVRAARIDRLRETLASRGIDYASERSGLEDTDLSEAISRLSAQTLTLEAAQSAFARINRRTLIDILS